MALCDRCKIVFGEPHFSTYRHSNLHDRFTVDRDFYHHHFNIGSLAAALEAKCGICHRLVHMLTSRNEDNRIFDRSSRLHSYLEPSTFLMAYRLAFESKSKSVISIHCVIKAKKAGVDQRELREDSVAYLFLSPEQAPLQPITEPPAWNGVHMTSMNTITSWVDNCYRNHATCRREAAPIPQRRFARCLDVLDGPSVKLCPADQLPQAAVYMTLSHCWGGVQDIPILTKQNYLEYLQLIAIRSLPQTFQDAILLTRQLDIRFLWIDSLCIIQDSEEDWLDQAGIMGSVYQNSYLNIAATGSSNSHGGLFMTRNPVVITPLRISIDVPVPEHPRSHGQDLQSRQTSLKDLPKFGLEGNSTLVAYFHNAVTEDVESRLDLNACIGNSNGIFDETGANFAHTAINVSLNGMKLHASLRTVSGDWKSSAIDIKKVVRWTSGKLTPLKSSAQQDVNEGKASTQKKFYDVGTDFYDKWTSQITLSRLCNRAWVVQERLLAPRIIHFAQEQLFWECIEANACEERPDTVIDTHQAAARLAKLDFKAWDVYATDLIQIPTRKPMKLNYIWSSLKAMHGHGAESQFRKDDLVNDHNLLVRARKMCYGDDDWMPTHSMISFWAEILRTYSSTSLTRIEDRLIAIEGLARILSERTGISYAAGLWQYQIPRQLLWTVEQRSIGRNGQQYIAPSWSWASTMGTLTIQSLKLDSVLEKSGAMDLIKVLSVNVEGVKKQDEVPLGQLKAGSIQIRGRLLPTALNLSAWPMGEVRKNHIVQFWVGSTQNPPVGESFLLPVVFTRWNKRLPEGTANSLILEFTGIKGVYRRIGTARLSSYCSLTDIIPQLYEAGSVSSESSDDDESDKDPADDNFSPELSSTRKLLPSPQQELSNSKMLMMTSGGLQTAMAILQADFERNPPQTPEGSALERPKLATMQNFFSKMESLAQQFPDKMLNQQLVSSTTSVEELAARFQRAGKGATDKKTTVVESGTNISPKKAVAPHFYLEYIDSDPDVVRYGHFVFDII